ncbi:hypothetical protein [Neotamlana nanhaiensis]|nr:hypothetical protein [Tamlana nanhaiensis]
MQIRFPDKGNFQNQVLIINSKTHIRPTLFYERVFYQNNKKIIKEYINDKISCSYEEEIFNHFIITKGFSVEGKLSSTEVIYFDYEGIPYMSYSEVKNSNGELDICYRRIYPNGKQSLKGFKDFFSCYYNIHDN